MQWHVFLTCTMLVCSSRDASIPGMRVFPGCKYSRDASIPGMHVLPGCKYFRDASTPGMQVLPGCKYSRDASIPGMQVFPGCKYSRDKYSRDASIPGMQVFPGCSISGIHPSLGTTPDTYNFTYPWISSEGLWQYWATFLFGSVNLSELFLWSSTPRAVCLKEWFFQPTMSCLFKRVVLSTHHELFV